jgi:uncharacterized protein (DUF58 family)
LWLPAWVTTRFLYALGAIALLLACAPAAAFFVPLAIVLGVFVATATIADALVGPATREIFVRRVPPEHFALAVPAELGYTVENRSTRDIRIGIIETPVRTLHFDVDELVGEVPSGSRVTMRRPALPVARGSDELGTIYVWYENALGLLQRRLRSDVRQPIRVFPNLRALRRSPRP